MLLRHGEWISWLEENEEILGFDKYKAFRMLKIAKANLASTLILNDFTAKKISSDFWGNATGTQGHISKDRDWYTPEMYIEMARKVMGSIDLDPASDSVAQKPVKRCVSLDMLRTVIGGA